MRDMGYFILAEFTLIEKKGASWLSRIPANVFVNTPEGQPIEEILQKPKPTPSIWRSPLASKPSPRASWR